MPVQTSKAVLSPNCWNIKQPREIQVPRRLIHKQGWKLKPKPKPENPVLKEIFETQTETDTYLDKILKT